MKKTQLFWHLFVYLLFKYCTENGKNFFHHLTNIYIYIFFSLPISLFYLYTIGEAACTEKSTGCSCVHCFAKRLFTIKILEKWTCCSKETAFLFENNNTISFAHLSSVTETHTDLIFLQGNLAHLSVSNKGARHFIHPLTGSHPDDVIHGQVSCLLPNLTLEHTHTHTQIKAYPPLLFPLFYVSLRCKHFKNKLFFYF